jgi:aminoglycoside 3-N-acetyltransferase I
MFEFRTKRLTPRDREEARRLFTLMAQVFSEDCNPLSDGYLDQLLSRREFWAIAAYSGEDIIGGITAHVLPMTRAESSEIFIYDVAVRAEYQRRGVGRRLLTALREQTSESGMKEMFVAADRDDLHALDFYRALGGVPSPVTIFTFSGNVPERAISQKRPHEGHL